MRWGIFFWVMWVGVAKGQSFDEWFRQKSTQLKYLKQQIAALESYITVTEEGYSIVQEGTKVIAAIKKGDFDMHSGYFLSLGKVKPGVSASPLVGEIAESRDKILIVADEAEKMVEGKDLSLVVAGFFRVLLQGCADDMDWLSVLISDGSLSLKDDERLAGIEGVYERMKKRMADAVRVRNAVIEIQGL